MRPKHVPGQLLTLVALLMLGCAVGADKREVPSSQRWTSRAIPEARGEVKEIEGKRVQIRYRHEPFSTFTVNYEQWPTYAYSDNRVFSQPARVAMPDLKGDPARGRQLFMARNKAPCTGCHLIPGDDVWPAGSVGPDLSVIGDRRLPDRYLFELIWDPRLFFPNTSMPPWGPAGILSAEEVVHIVAFLQTLKGNPPFVPPPEKDPTRNPHTRPTILPYYGDNLDPATNPAVVFADNVNMTMLIKMQSNGMPVNVDITSPEAAAAYERGRAVYFKRVGQRNHACADCHEADRGAGRYAGARLLSPVREGLTKHFPLW